MSSYNSKPKTVWSSTDLFCKLLMVSEHTTAKLLFPCLSNSTSDFRLSLQAAVPQQVESTWTVELIRQFGRLYHEDREAALQALNDMEQLKEVHSLKGKILFSVVVVTVFFLVNLSKQ